MVHKLEVAILVELLGRLAQLALREEIDWAFFVSHLDIFVIADYITSFR